MVRPCKKRKICCRVGTGYFKPGGIPMTQLEDVELFLDEAEALRLKDLEGLYHHEAAQRMGISRQTFDNIINSAHRKIAEAILKRKALKIKQRKSFNVNPNNIPK